MSFNNIDTIQDLQYIVLFGTASLFFYLVVPVALFANEVRLAKQSDDTSGTAAIFNSLVQAFFYILGWSIFVSIIFFLVIKLGHSDENNPAVGIARYWLLDWVSGNPISHLTIDTFPLSGASTDDIVNQAKILVLIIVWGNGIKIMLLGVLLSLTLKLSFSLPLLKMRRSDHYKMVTGMDAGTIMSMFMVGIFGFIVFQAIMNFESILLSSLLIAGQQHIVPTVITNTDVNMTDGIRQLIDLGMQVLPQ